MLASDLGLRSQSGYGADRTISPEAGDSEFQALLDIWFPEKKPLPTAFLVDTSEEALLLPDWLKLRMIRSEVPRLVDAGTARGGWTAQGGGCRYCPERVDSPGRGMPILPWGGQPREGGVGTARGGGQPRGDAGTAGWWGQPTGDSGTAWVGIAQGGRWHCLGGSGPHLSL